MKTLLRSGLALSCLAVLGGCGDGSGGSVTTGLAERDDAKVSLVAGDVNLGSTIRATGLSLVLTGKGGPVSDVCWRFWKDKDCDGEIDEDEVIEFDYAEEAKPSHSFRLADISIKKSEQYKYKITYRMVGANGPLERTTSVGSILP